MYTLKYSYLLFFALLLTNIGCDKEEIGALQSKSFVKYYGSNFNDAGEQVIVLDDGGYVIMGNIETQSQGKDICLIRTDGYGNSIGSIKLYGSLFDDNGFAIKKNRRGFIIAGSKEVSNGGKRDILLIQVDVQGNELFNTSFGSAQNEEAYDILTLDNGSYILTGYSDSIPERKKDLMVAKTDQNGNLIWINLVGFPGDGDEEGYSVASIDSSNFLIAGYTKSRPWGTTGSNIFVVNWEDKGGGIGYASPTIYPVDGNSVAVSLVPAGNNDFIVSSNVTLFAQAKEIIKTMKIHVADDKSIETLWTTNLGERANNEISRSYINNGKIYIVGTSGESELYGDILLISINEAGNSPIYHYIGDGGSYLGKDMGFTLDGGFVVTGSNHINLNNSITLIKVDSEAGL